jgi:pimeloyl-ACP methyl ester carboxylesterase
LYQVGTDVDEDYLESSVMIRAVLFLGGNGHCAARLDPARAVLAAFVKRPFELVDVAYPGFECRPKVCSLEAFLDLIAAQLEAQCARPGWRGLAYGTGIGGLLLLCLRAQGRFLQLPLVLQAPILWGLEKRRFPRLMRLGPVRRLFQRMLAWPLVQIFIVRRLFRSPMAPLLRADFFGGYAQCSALGDLFAWLTPTLLRELEEQFRLRPDKLQRITVWWGQHDRVVTPRELAVTEAALAFTWSLRVIPHWGHYPMIDDPANWVRALQNELEGATGVSGQDSSEAQ